MLLSFTSHQFGVSAIKYLRNRLNNDYVLLGLDSGKKRWGIAISDARLRVALPLLQYTRCKYYQDLEFLSDIIYTRLVGGIIIGFPLHMNGKSSPRTQAVIKLGTDINKFLGIGVAYWDERMSSLAMERQMIEIGNVSRLKRRKSLDKLAATYILQGALDSLTFNYTFIRDK